MLVAVKSGVTLAGWAAKIANLNYKRGVYTPGSGNYRRRYLITGSLQPGKKYTDRPALKATTEYPWFNSHTYLLQELEE